MINLTNVHVRVHVGGVFEEALDVECLPDPSDKGKTSLPPCSCSVEFCVCCFLLYRIVFRSLIGKSVQCWSSASLLTASECVISVCGKNS